MAQVRDSAPAGSSAVAAVSSKPLNDSVKPSDAPTNAAPDAANASPWGFYRWVMLLTLLLVSISNLLIRYFIVFLYSAPVDGLTPEEADRQSMKHALGLTGKQFGLLVGPVFMGIFAIVSTGSGWIADNGPRVLFVGIGLVIWSGATALMGLSTSFWHVLGARAMQALGQGLCPPLAYSLLASYFPPHERGTANGIFSSGVYLGYGGSSLTLLLFPELGWRKTCYFVGGASTCIVLIHFLILREPKRPAKPVADKESDSKQSAKTPLPVPTIPGTGGSLQRGHSSTGAAGSKRYEPPELVVASPIVPVAPAGSIARASSALSADGDEVDNGVDETHGDLNNDVAAGEEDASGLSLSNAFSDSASSIASTTGAANGLGAASSSNALSGPLAAAADAHAAYVEGRRSACGSLGLAVHTTSVRLVLLATCLRMVGGLVLGSFLPEMLKRAYPTQKDEYAILNSIVVVVGGTASALFGGRICDAWSRAATERARDRVRALRRGLETGEVDAATAAASAKAGVQGDGLNAALMGSFSSDSSASTSGTGPSLLARTRGPAAGAKKQRSSGAADSANESQRVSLKSPSSRATGGRAALVRRAAAAAAATAATGAGAMDEEERRRSLGLGLVVLDSDMDDDDDGNTDAARDDDSIMLTFERPNDEGLAPVSSAQATAAMAAGVMPTGSARAALATPASELGPAPLTRGKRLELDEEGHARDLQQLHNLVPFAAVSSISCLLSLPFTLAVVLLPGLRLAMASLFCAYLVGESWFGPLFVIVGNHANITPRARGMAMALLVSASGLASSLGPFIVGALDDWLGDIKLELTLGVALPNLLAGIIFLVLTFRLRAYQRRRVALAEERLARAAEEASY